MRTFKLIIDDREIEARNGNTLLEAALGGGIYIPHLCYHPDLKPIGKCGICIVEIEGQEEPQPSCKTAASPAMVVKTKTPRVEEMRRQAMASLLINHPPECVECSQYLNCELQSVKQYIGITEAVASKTSLKPIPKDTRNPLFLHDFIRCIKCERCVRACNDLRGAGVLQMIENGESSRVGIPEGKSLAEAGCLFCGACVEVCPSGAMRDKEELMEGKKRRQALLPCVYTCPAQIDVPRYVRLVRKGKYAEATAVIREKVPFPNILGYVCNHPCENVCRRGEVNEAISIRELKRFAVENDRERLWEKNALRAESTDKKVAIVGSGPAGLTAAYYLAKLGHGVTVFEALPKAGGMMRYGIPEYRLPRQVLESEIEEIKKLGVGIETGKKITDLDQLTLDEGYDAVLIAVGSHSGKKPPIAGADHDRVLIGTDFLRKVNLGEKATIGKRVVVLGGGNVAFDCARVARRLGGTEIHIACLEVKKDMPVACDEIEQGEEEGIVVHPSRTFTKILTGNERIVGVECLEVASFEFEEDGTPSIDIIDGTEHVLPADTVIFAIGQLPEIPESFDLEVDDRGCIEMDPYTFETDVDGVFAAGDAVSGTATVIEAIASGKKGAVAVDRYLGGDGDIDETLVPLDKPNSWLGQRADFADLVRTKECCIAPSDRLQSFCSISQTLDKEQAVSEADRCLQCDLRFRITPVKFWGEF